ncbi:hypothetical protein [Paenibacillus cymbidii]|uniref:hypothetical protein n=1 Tax=Paenibacillus cymbidii TaxID=1639034 RepID=UPI0010805889|nr:hypothetical protein [Paenibacillus cymbidii]
MSERTETKHQTFNLKWENHPTFRDQMIVKDADGDVFLWMNRITGFVSFSFKYFHVYREQLLVEALERYVLISQMAEDGELEIAELKQMLKLATVQAAYATGWSRDPEDDQPRGEGPR